MAETGVPRSSRTPTYRITELKRWRSKLGIPLNIEPKFFPCGRKFGAFPFHPRELIRVAAKLALRTNPYDGLMLGGVINATETGCAIEQASCRVLANCIPDRK